MEGKEELKQETNLSLLQASKKRKRNQLKGPTDYGNKPQAKKRKVGEGMEELKGGEEEGPNAANQQAVDSKNQNGSNQEVLSRQEVTLEELVRNHKAFFDSLKKPETQTQIQNSLKQKMFGNYEKYTKPGRNKWNDSRIKKLEKEWLEGKRVLDIGCHNGTLDLVLCARYNPKLMIGIDMNHRLVSAAINFMQKAINDQEEMKAICSSLQAQQRSSSSSSKMDSEVESQIQSKSQERGQQMGSLVARIRSLPLSYQLGMQGQLKQLKEDPYDFIRVLQEEGVRPSHKELKNYLYGKVCFRTEHYLQRVESLSERFDTIICLSTLKWLHLNYGDVGLKCLFLKAFEQLAPGGVFLVEHQTWKTYKQKAGQVKAFKETMRGIQLRPHLFKDYLQRVGFKHLKTIPPSEQEGGDKYLMVFQKQ